MYKLYLSLVNKLNKTVCFFIASIALSTIVLSPVYALKDDIEKPVHINADSVLFNKAKGLAVYEGNVTIVQGTLDIRASKIEINAVNNEISRITASGSPVSFQQKMDDGKLAKGKANRVIYQVKEKRIVLDGNASISQNNDQFASNHIEYSTVNGELKAGDKKAPGKGRVKAIFYPTNKTK
ncbi:hypothetical protein GCM10009133_03900 [Cocleimonas flava]|uniref:Lipopolysaccharide export system protein LptA n=1 Tax=Cocleimonas flava TaxID=634765 RepID=A0A4R1F7U4_9GAMM|nr:lipopolysaccharide transport periplasmic protein LptA [Cocleimonas flava]TCJ86761.1 lipopolysaccharide export system protein LptA [Cocleimonas flava]